MVETFNNFELLRMDETWNPLTMTCVKLESRLYTRESEKKIGRRGEGSDGIERGTAHVSLFYITGLLVRLRTGFRRGCLLS